jgi:hypothetical protein
MTLNFVIATQHPRRERRGARASTSERAEGEILKDPKCFAREKFFSDDARRVSAVDDEF